MEDRLKKLLSRLAAPVEALPLSENSGLPAGRCAVREGKLCLALPEAGLMLRCPEDTPGGADILLLSAALAVPEQGSDEELCAAILRGELTGHRLEEAARRCGLRDALCCRVLLMRLPGNAALLKGLTPTEDRDLLTVLDRDTAALVKDMTGLETPEEAAEFALALRETVLEETGGSITVGVGGLVRTPEALAEGAAQARTALEAGGTFRPEEQVFLWEKTVLERLLAETRPETLQALRRQLSGGGNDRLLTEEMLSTIRMFFRKDLNLSDTARQLFIHRNTLIYRLDRIKAQTGLDLRCFDDAVTFRILMEMHQAGREVRREENK